MASERARRCLDPGVAVVVATVDATGAPEPCRAIAIASQDADLETITVYVPAATSEATIANLTATRRIAVVATYPPDHFSVQLKGTVAGVRPAADADEPFLAERLAQFATTLDVIGVPERVTHRLNHWPAVAIDVRVDGIFEQTPGPRAGEPMR